MCGIHGYIGRMNWGEKKPSRANVRDSATDGFITGMVRGHHSSGVFAIPLDKDKQVPVVKRAYTGFDFLGSTAAKKLFEDHNTMLGYVGHLRLATRGDVHMENAHPFQHGPITMVHNGTLRNERLLGDWDFSTDSEFICKSLADRPDPRDTIKLLDGAFALVWHDRRTNKVYMTRNGDRELAYAYIKNRNMLMFASEWPMLKWLAWRNYIEVEEIEDVTPFDILEFDPEEPRNRVIIKAEGYVSPPVIPHVYAGGDHRPFVKSTLPTIISGGNGADESKVPNIYKRGSTVEFSVTDLHLNKRASRMGTVEGIMTEHPHWRVVARAIDTRKFSGTKRLLGQVVNYLCLESDWPTVYVAFKGESDNPDVNDKGVSGSYNRHYARYDESKSNPILAARKKSKGNSIIPALLDSERDPDAVLAEVVKENPEMADPQWYRTITVDGMRYSVYAAKKILGETCLWCGDPFRDLKDIGHVDGQHVCLHNCGDAIPFLKIGMNAPGAA